MQVKGKPEEVAQRLEAARVIGIARLGSAEAVVEACLVAIARGLTAIEVPFTVPGAADAIKTLRSRSVTGILIGAGTVRTEQQCEAALVAGADFFVAPAFNSAILRAAAACGSLLVPGVFTPTEVEAALDAGLPLLKLFPALPAGPQHLAALLQPFPEARFMPTGGIGPDNARAFLAAGAAALAMGSSIFHTRRLEVEGPEAVGPLVQAALESARVEA